MITDNFPVHFRYISERLVTDIVQQWVAGRAEIEVGEVGANFGIFQATIKAAEIDWGNKYQLVKLATLAVKDHTGWIDANDRQRRIPNGDYVRARMYLQKSLVPVRGWENGGRHAVAGFAGWEELPDFGRVFVGLIGSEANLSGVQTTSRLTLAGRTASDLMGWYELINATREAGEPRADEDYLAQERSMFSDTTELLAEAADSFSATHMMGQSELLDSLFLVHESATEVDLQLRGPDGESLGLFKIALLGAPIWVATPDPEVNQRLLPSGQRAYQHMAAERGNDQPTARQVPIARTPEVDPRRRMSGLLDRGYPAWTDHESVPVSPPGLLGARSWDLFDAWVAAYIDAWQQHIKVGDLVGWPPENDDWRSFCRWAVDIALRFANRPWPFVRPVAQRATFRLRRTAERRADDQAGWITSPRYARDLQPVERERYFMLLTNAEVYQCDKHGHATGGNPKPVSGVDTGPAATAILRTVARWNTPFSPVETPDPVIDDAGHLTFD
jgi:hypothetical protein